MIRKLISVPENRLGINGAEEIKKHQFFNGFDWKNIRNKTAPFIPEVTSSSECKYFETFKETEPFYPPNKVTNKVERKVKK